MLHKFTLILLIAFVFCARWSPEKAQEWYSKYKWSAGFNYAPSYAVNQIQMWTSFNSTTIDRQLTWAQQIGFSVLRVFLHVGPFTQNKTDFFNKIDGFLDIASSHKHKVILVLFDDCWKSTFHMGQQPDPIPGIHNSQWVQCPGDNNISTSTLEDYTKTVINAFKNDERVVMWDLYNEVGNSQKGQKSYPLIKNVFNWAQTVNPSQPLTSGHWTGDIAFQRINNLILSESDIITFHAYCDKACTENTIQKMKSLKRPVICTQYMARPLQSKFITHLPIFKEKNVWAINWGFVYGRTQTYYPWWSKKGDPVPQTWFHDVVHTDGKSFDQKQTAFIKNITNV